MLFSATNMDDKKCQRSVCPSIQPVCMNTFAAIASCVENNSIFLAFNENNGMSVFDLCFFIHVCAK